MDTVATAAPEAPARGMTAIYGATIFLAFHGFLVMYINSSFIEQFLADGSVGMVYLIGSALTVLIFLAISRILRKVGNYRITMWLMGMNACAVVGMAFASSFEMAILCLLVHLISLSLILFNFDVFLEAIIGNNEGTTGSRRGIILALTSFIGALSPLLAGFIIDAGDSFKSAYLLSAMALFPVFMILIFHFRHFQDPLYPEIDVMTAFRSFWVRRNIRIVFLANLLLQIFFCFMVVYAPLYLATKINLSWSEIGIIIFAGQLAYVLFEYPIGHIADAYVGEKEMMAAGFFIVAVTSAALAAIVSTTILPWVLTMFATRVGASLIEVTTESYFFKHTRSSDAQIISFFRLTKPLSYVVGAALGSLTLLFLPFSLVFVVAGLVMVPGIALALSLEDTK